MRIPLNARARVLTRAFAGPALRFAACLALIVLLVSVQVVHVHMFTGTADTTCLTCVSARTSVPVAAVVTQLVLVAIAYLPAILDLTVPASGPALLLLFIRPPPSA